MAAKPIYRVVFLNQGKVYEVYARHVSQTGALFGFVEIEELIFARFLLYCGGQRHGDLCGKESQSDRYVP